MTGGSNGLDNHWFQMGTRLYHEEFPYPIRVLNGKWTGGERVAIRSGVGILNGKCVVPRTQICAYGHRPNSNLLG
jgi:hypothetical protein